MVQITNQGEAFYCMKYLGGDTPAYHTSGNRFQELVRTRYTKCILAELLKMKFLLAGHWMYMCLMRVLYLYAIGTLKTL